MNYKVLTISPFDKQLKRLVKKFPSLKEEFAKLIEVLELNPYKGTPVGNNYYKVRLAISSKGKSGGARIITNVVVQETTVFLLSIYDKSEKQNITDKELIELLKEVPE
jgi:hypothetical protein